MVREREVRSPFEFDYLFADGNPGEVNVCTIGGNSFSNT